jgi:para-nitrobenzyl esterase
VVVTLNHRLNAFGYLYLAHLGAGFEDAGNAGQLDLVLALQWVRDNIAAFGGDPDQVTVFGQSGGGSKAATLMAMPAARGLFHRAILQSGFGLTGIPVEEAKKITDVVLQELGLPPARARDLRRVPVERLVAAVRKATGGTPVGIGPVVDGRSLARHPFTPDAPAQAADIPVMLGANKDEATVLFPPPDAFSLDWAGLHRHLQAALPDADVDELIRRLRALRPAATPSQLYFTVTTELGMGHNSRTFATRKSRQPAPVYLYRMEWETPLDGGRLGAYHGLEVALAFDNVAVGTRFTGRDAEAAQKVADAMSEAWVRFARTGSPNGPGLAWWPVFEPENQPTMIFEESSRAVGDPVRELRMLLEAPPPRR